MRDKTKCNICGLPDTVSYREQDLETGATVWKSHTVDCGGHQGIHPALWNKAYGGSTSGIRSIGYEEFQKLYERMRKQNEKSKRSGTDSDSKK